jgi:hypothetical protein
MVAFLLMFFPSSIDVAKALPSTSKWAYKEDHPEIASPGHSRLGNEYEDAGTSSKSRKESKKKSKRAKEEEEEEEEEDPTDSTTSSSNSLKSPSPVSNQRSNKNLKKEKERTDSDSYSFGVAPGEDGASKRSALRKARSSSFKDSVTESSTIPTLMGLSSLTISTDPVNRTQSMPFNPKSLTVNTDDDIFAVGGAYIGSPVPPLSSLTSPISSSINSPTSHVSNFTPVNTPLHSTVSSPFQLHASRTATHRSASMTLLDTGRNPFDGLDGLSMVPKSAFAAPPTVLEGRDYATSIDFNLVASPTNLRAPPTSPFHQNQGNPFDDKWGHNPTFN